MEQKIKQDDVIRVGENIGRLRREQNMTQEDMTRELQLSGVSVSRGNRALRKSRCMQEGG